MSPGLWQKYKNYHTCSLRDIVYKQVLLLTYIVVDKFHAKVNTVYNRSVMQPETEWLESSLLKNHVYRHHCRTHHSLRSIFRDYCTIYMYKHSFIVQIAVRLRKLYKYIYTFFSIQFAFYLSLLFIQYIVYTYSIQYTRKNEFASLAMAMVFPRQIMYHTDHNVHCFLIFSMVISCIIIQSACVRYLLS